MKKFLVYSVIIVLVVALLSSPVIIYKLSEKSVSFTVANRERVVDKNGSSYLVWSEDNRVFEITDTITFWRWDSSNRYGQLIIGHEYQATVAGWRIPFLSMYENLIDLKDVTPKPDESDSEMDNF